MDTKNILLLILAGAGGYLIWRALGSGGISLPDFSGGEEGSSDEGTPLVNAPATSTYTTIANFEGFSATPYPDAGGYSIGYGHYMGAVVTIPGPITQAQGLDLLQADVASAARTVSSLVSVPLTQNQYDALVSLAYNIGSNAFANSTLVSLLNQGDYAGAAAQFPVWNKSQGKVIAALVSRREAEKGLFLT